MFYLFNGDKAMTNKLQSYTSLLMALCAIFFSSVFINILIRMGFAFDYLAFDLSDLIGGTEVPYLTSFIFILFKRLKQAFLIAVLMKLFKPSYIYHVIILGLGFFYGLMMSVQTFAGGIREVGVFLLGIFPHYVIYILAVDMMYKFYSGKIFNRSFLKFITVLLIMLVLGVIFEGNFLKIFLR